MTRALVIGNSDGIGLALTRRLLADGWDVVGVSRRASEVVHGRYAHHVADVTGADFPAVLAGVGPVDACVYAAGVGEVFDVGDLAAQTRAVEVNLLGAARAVEAVVPAMVAAGRGHFVGLSSLADVLVSPDSPGYAASKAGLSSYLLGLAGALRRHGVAVTCVRFGFVDTKMAKGDVKPMLVGVERAVDVLVRALRTRPVVVSYPKRMSVLARALRIASGVRVGR
ncbi:SDR family NAD(P)-dependent oxidoreductase [Saccharothrix syringae]|uniref:SDR family NAD(P)-dependent oxidoreductase n=1 Tax=Saccharothrix syringae TaxID=103733 RepID=A0A5Q0GW94_SACSY|nr:SDR family NAD(P)-dependent oxidoreductase [Saccharothrix syringae]QFZ18396.1 SDR family NAD(P)-dependent oxidoreductase [Saccharothrix syringae]